MERPKNITDKQWQTATEIYNSAKRQGDKYPELTVAQAALETGWFKKPSGKNNYFGQKATSKQAGTTLRTTEVAGNKAYKINDKFRDYNTIDEAVSDRIKKWGSKYQDANNVEEAISKIWKYDANKGQGVGYATDPKYGSKIKSILGTLGTSNLSSEIKQKQTFPQEQTQTGYIGMLPTELPEVYGQPYIAEEESKEESPKRTDNANKLGFVADYEELSKQYEQQLQVQQKPLIQQEIVEGVQYQPLEQSFKNGGIKVDSQGYWNPANEGKPVIIPSPQITMKGIDYPIYGKSLETGEVKLMTPNNDYFFANTQNVLEQPVKFQEGGETDFIKNWYQNRKTILDKENKPVNVDFSNVDSTPNFQKVIFEDKNTLGEYNPSNKTVSLSENYKRIPGIVTHEVNHHIQSQMKPIDAVQYLVNPVYDTFSQQNIEAEQKDRYLFDPYEIHSRVMQFREDNNLKPNEVIDEKTLKNTKNRDLYRLEMFDDNQMLDLLNKTVDIKNIKNNNYFV